MMLENCTSTGNLYGVSDVRLVPANMFMPPDIDGIVFGAHRLQY